MHLALNMAKLARGVLSRAAIQETQYLINKSLSEVRKGKKHSAAFPGHK